MTEKEMTQMMETAEGRKQLRSTPEGRAFYDSHIPVRLVGGPVIGYTNLSEHLQVEGCSRR